MPQYGLVCYQAPGAARTGLLIADQVIDIAAALERPGFACMQTLLSSWDEALSQLDELAAGGAAARVPLRDVQLLAPVPAPLAIYCIGANYHDHVRNMAHATGRVPEPNPHEIDMPPWFFLKSGHCVVGPGASVALDCAKLDWEAELVVVIGRKMRNVSAQDALAGVAGYTMANDLSARDRAIRRNGDPSSPFFYDFVAQKSFEGSCPLGPVMVPAQFIEDPQAMPIQLWVNDRLRIDSSTARMIFTIREQIAQLSTFITLHPGDLILTGTPAGAGAETNEYLRQGDSVRIQITGIGTLVTHIV